MTLSGNTIGPRPALTNLMVCKRFSILPFVVLGIGTVGCLGSPEELTEPEELGTLARALTQSSTLVDSFDSFNASLWTKANWAAFSDANRTNSFASANATLSSSRLALKLSNVNGTLANGAEVDSVNQFSYGLFQVRMKPVAKSGTVSSFFTWRTGNWDEIDIEFLGKDTTKVQYNHFSNGVGGHEHLDNLGFDAAADYHLYAFEWAPHSLRYYVDGTLRHTTWTDIPDEAQQVIMNVWARNDATWAGPFSTSGLPRSASYDYVKVSPSLVVNPGFSSNLDDWIFWKHASASASAQWDNTVAKVNISSGGSADWHVQFYQGGKGLMSGKSYRASFDAKGSCSRTIAVRLEDAQFPYTVYGASQTFSIGTSWSAYSFTLNAATTDADARLLFALGNSNCSVWLDNLSIVQL
jgi:licheninase